MKKVDFDIEGILQKSLNIYHYGSYVYNTFVDGASDYDFIVILPDDYAEFDKEQFEDDDFQYTFYTQSTWQTMLDNHDVCAIEIYFLPNKFVLKKTVEFKTTIVPQKIREKFSQVASNSYVKCKKKLEVQESFSPRVGKKSLWHSLRIIDFGIQILKNGQIVDYTSMNYLYDDIVKCDVDEWAYYKQKYKPLYNSLKTQFRLCV